MKINQLFNDLLSLLYPELCQACGNSLFRNEHSICLSCLYKLPKTNFHLEKNNLIEMLFWGRVVLQKACSFLYFRKGNRVQNSIHALKYKSKREIGIYLGELLAKDLKKNNWLDDIDIIIPVPLYYKKQLIRGYNQSEEFAKGLIKGSNLRIENNVLQRIIPSETQTKKSRYKRWENVNEHFKLNQTDIIKGKHILIVDDVITTGATIEACAQKLLSVEGTKISVATLAYAVN